MVTEKEKLQVLSAIDSLRAHIKSEHLAFEIHRVVKDLMEADNAVVIFEDRNVDQYWIATRKAEEREVSYTIVNAARRNPSGYCYRELTGAERTKSQIRLDVNYCCAAVVETSSAKDDRIGVIYCDVRRGPRKYTEQDAIFLKFLGDHLAIYLETVLLQQSTARLNRRTREFVELQTEHQDAVLERLIGSSPTILRIKDDVKRFIAKADETVLIQGESGTGKNVLARIIHDLSDRSAKEFVTVECSNLHKEIAYSELFGHKKGSYSSAFEGRPGLVRSADGGTLFLDEIGDLALEQQGMLLRLLQEGSVRPMGDDKEIKVDIRVVCATNRNLKKMVQNGAFREDLFFRIHRIPVYLPPLRDRKEDISAIANHLVSTQPSRKKGQKVDPFTISREAHELLKILPLPGNVRELVDLLAVAKLYSENNLITEENLQQVLARQSEQDIAFPYPRQNPLFLQLERGELSLDRLQQLWREKSVSREDLRAFLQSLIQESGDSFTEMGKKRLGICDPRDVHKFQNWIHYLRTLGILPQRPARHAAQPQERV